MLMNMFDGMDCGSRCATVRITSGFRIEHLDKAARLAAFVVQLVKHVGFATVHRNTLIVVRAMMFLGNYGGWLRFKIRGTMING